MRLKNGIIALVAVSLISTLLTEPALAYGRPAGRGHQAVRSAHYPRHGSFSFWLPAVTALVIAGMTYYYSEGVYYRKAPLGYVVAPPPRGAVVRSIPQSYSPAIVNNNNYYAADDVYYQSVPSGYMVVEKPAQTVIINNNVNSGNSNRRR